MKLKLFIITALLFNLSAVCVYAVNPQNKLNSINSAKILAERNIVETVYGIKLRYKEEVTNILEGNFQGSTETKTGKRKIVGIEFESITYDPDKDIAMATATLKLSRLGNIVDKKKFNIDKNPDKIIKRVAFASSNPDNAAKIAAIRAAEIDAYKNLYKQIGGFTLESHTKVENFVLKSDKVKASVIGALMGAQFVGYRWEGKGNDAIAIVKLRINMHELSEMLGEKIIDFNKEYLTSEGMAAIKTEKSIQQTKFKASKPIVKVEVIEEDIELMP